MPEIGVNTSQTYPAVLNRNGGILPACSCPLFDFSSTIAGVITHVGYSFTGDFYNITNLDKVEIKIYTYCGLDGTSGAPPASANSDIVTLPLGSLQQNQCGCERLQNPIPINCDNNNISVSIKGYRAPGAISTGYIGYINITPRIAMLV
jgi:hypothetical protein